MTCAGISSALPAISLMTPRGCLMQRVRAATDGTGLAETRVRFLTEESVQNHKVRDPILASWKRSRHSRVAADRVEIPYIADPDLESPLARSAAPVLSSLHEYLGGQPISIILTDSSGLVVSRLCGDSGIERHLDRVLLAPGFSYAESYVGTNGIGTALEDGGPAHVFGHEHYAENLEDLACAGVPIQHPVTGKVVGAVDLTCWRSDAGPLLIALAKITAAQIRQSLLMEATIHEVELLQEYLRVCRRSAGIVLALDTNVGLMNDFARTMLCPADQAALLLQAGEALKAGRRTEVLVLPSATTVKVYVRPVEGSASAGVVHAKIVEQASSRPAVLGSTIRMLLPGLVGTGPVWRHACDEVEAAYAAGDWLAVTGEPGVGKLAVLRAVLQRRNPAGRFTALEATSRDIRRALLEDPPGAVVLRHLERLGTAGTRALSATLQEAALRPGMWVALTGLPTDEILLRLFPTTADIPPLRHHIEDLQLLVPFFLSRLGFGGKLTCSPEAMQTLMRAQWPGNVEQVLHTLRCVVEHRRSGVIQPQDLPSDIGSVSRRRLSPLESLERDAIAQSLANSHGNKAVAASALGMSRATIYRKIHQFGIVPPTTEAGP
ncbi:MAG: sigma-54 dependent transcriptional regulator, acetoin dehydrogenase operon transcriptional [Frankiales bacterium]|nr:sigma-54 dependent transcriptional regulator, acetoin dehydrogenase operon transcriptional [Frankiales bacterium]